jgi:uncharacterized short protein YbdD (DUF466 family)
MLVRLLNAGTRERWKSPVFCRSVVPSFLSFLRRVAGMPDYSAYTEHLRRFHPERPLPSERDYFSEYLRSRYGDGPTRCC